MTMTDPIDDADLVALAKQGDRAALDRLLRLHQPRVHLVCRRITGNDADALDATQEALIAIVRGLPRFDGRSRFSTWAYRIATNACLDELRRRRRRPEPGLDDSRGVEPVQPGGSPEAVVAAGSWSTRPWRRWPRTFGPRWSSATCVSWTTPRSPRS